MKRLDSGFAALLLIASLALLPTARAAEPGKDASVSHPLTKFPSRPQYPVKMDAMTDAEFGKLFFAEIDLEHPVMQSVKPLVRKGDYSGAIAAWAQVFQHHIAGVRAEPWSGFNWYPLDTIMDPRTVRMQHGLTIKDFGPPGSMDWHSPRDYQLHVNFMWHPKAIIRGLEQNLAAAEGNGKPTSYGNEALLTRWADVWRDYCSNNWRIGLPLALNTAARIEALRLAGMTAPNLLPGANHSEWCDLVQFVNQWCVGGCLLWNWAESLVRAQHASPQLFSQCVPPRCLAEMAYFFTVWPGGQLSGQEFGGTPAQFNCRLVALQKLVALMPEFYRNQKLDTEIASGVAFIMRTMVHPDGSNQTLSYNYAPWFVNMVNSLSFWISETQPKPAWWKEVCAHKLMEELWLANLETPAGGQLILGKNKYGNRKQMDPDAGSKALKNAGLHFPPAYTSIAFPWHGLYITRSGWDSNALYAALSNPRRGADHESEGNNKLHVEAYGRFILVDSPGEGWNDYMASSWSKNTIHVDGLDQARMAYPSARAYALPLPGRWHTSSFFDFAESTYDAGYGHVKKPVKGQSPVILADVRHTRQLIFVKEAKLWLVNDIIEAPPEAKHRYQQLWHFDYTYPRRAIVTDAASLSVCTTEAGKPNLALYMSGPAGLDYHSYFGSGCDSPGKTTMAMLAAGKARGWQNLASGYDDGEVVPAVEVEAAWQGTGRQTLLTALVPSPNESSPVASVERVAKADCAGLVLTLKDGRMVHCLVSTTGKPFALDGASVHSAVWTSKPDEADRGLFLDAPNSTGVEFLRRNGCRETVATLHTPASFHWVKKGDGEVPVYLTPAL
jgi:hypothetical protein